MKYSIKLGLLTMILLCAHLSGQTKPKYQTKYKSFQINTYGLFLIAVDDTDYSDENYELDKSNISGFDFEVNYWFADNFTIGLGSGYEVLNQPRIEYIPLYMGLRWYSSVEEGENWSFRSALGTHLGQVSKPGYFFRIGFQYQFPIIKKVDMELGVLVSYHRMRKQFIPDQIERFYYEFPSGGITLGFVL